LSTFRGVSPEDLDTADPPEVNAAYDTVNRALRSVFAEAALSAALRSERLSMCLDALVGDPERTDLRLECPGRRIGNVGFMRRVVAQCGAIETLQVNVGSCSQLSDVSALASLGQLSQLSLTLDLSGCKLPHDLAVRYEW